MSNCITLGEVSALAKDWFCGVASDECASSIARLFLYSMRESMRPMDKLSLSRSTVYCINNGPTNRIGWVIPLSLPCARIVIEKALLLDRV